MARIKIFMSITQGSDTIKQPWHFGQSVAGQTLDWLPSDEKKFFDENSKDTKFVEYIKQQGWDQPGAITYKINRHGFRCDEFDNVPNIIALGCSFTMGTGLPIQDIWPSRLGKQLKLQVYNLGWGGSAADTCFRLAEYWVPVLKPKLVVMLAPPPARIELAVNNSSLPFEVFLPMSESFMFNANDMFLRNWFSMDENAEINNRKNKLAIQALCNNLNIKFLVYDVIKDLPHDRAVVQYARDRMHAGPRAHEILVEKILTDLKSWP